MRREGNIASELTVDCFMSFLRERVKTETDEKTTVSLLENAISYANGEVYRKSLSDKAFQGMGTTLVGGILYGNAGVLANIGDSRAYSVKEHRTERLTHDHSVVEEMVDKGEITEEEARNHPRRNLITRALGTDAQVTADYNMVIDAISQLQ